MFENGNKYSMMQKHFNYLLFFFSFTLCYVPIISIRKRFILSVSSFFFFLHQFSKLSESYNRRHFELYFTYLFLFFFLEIKKGIQIIRKKERRH